MTLVKVNQGPKHLNDWLSPFASFDRILDDDFFGSRSVGFPAVNVAETTDSYSIEVAAPGLEKNDFSIQVEKNLLTISSEKKETSETKEGSKVIRKEFSQRSFKRTFTLDEKVDAETIQAKYENGVLKLTLPKKPESKETSRNISVL